MAEWSNAEVCKISYRGFESHPRLLILYESYLIQNRLTGRTPPFEGVYLGSNPSSGTSPIDGIGIHTCLRNKVLQVRVLYRALDFISKHMQDWSNGKTRDSKPFNVGSIPTSCAMPW